jgi:hypothetical protein
MRVTLSARGHDQHGPHPVLRLVAWLAPVVGSLAFLRFAALTIRMPADGSDRCDVAGRPRRAVPVREVRHRDLIERLG